MDYNGKEGFFVQVVSSCRNIMEECRALISEVVLGRVRSTSENLEEILTRRARMTHERAVLLVELITKAQTVDTLSIDLSTSFSSSSLGFPLASHLMKRGIIQKCQTLSTGL